MKFETKCVHAGQVPDPTTGSIIPPIYQTATYVLPEVGRDLGFDYSRSSNPTRQVLEENLAALDSGKYGVCYASGMSAVDAVMKLLKSGDHVVCSDDVYGGVSRHFNQVLTTYGLNFTYVDSTDAQNVADAIRPETRLIWLETPSNPLIKITDITAVSKIGKAAGIPVGVDSTFATPAFLRPLELGADIVMHSTTKYLSGHNQIIGGAIVVNDKKIYDRLKFIQKTIGAVNSPFDAWLTVLGVKTLHLRMQRHDQSGLRIAKFLEDHPKIRPGQLSRPEIPPPIRHRQTGNERQRRHAVLRTQGRHPGGQGVDERRRTMRTGGKPRLGGNHDYPSSHHDPRGCPRRRTQRPRPDRRLGAPVGGRRGRG